MNKSFSSFGKGFVISFCPADPDSSGAVSRSFIDPLLIMLAIPMGFIGVLIILPLTHTTLNVMSLMGVLMLILGIADSSTAFRSSISRIVCEEQGMPVLDAVW